MTLLCAFTPHSHKNIYLQTARALRNAKGWTEAQRKAAIEHANGVKAAQLFREAEDDANEDDVALGDDLEDDELASGGQIPSSFTSQSPARAGRRSSRSVLSAVEDTKASADELALNFEELGHDSRRASTRERRSGRKGR